MMFTTDDVKDLQADKDRLLPWKIAMDLHVDPMRWVNLSSPSFPWFPVQGWAKPFQGVRWHMISESWWANAFFPHHMWTLRWRKQSNYCWLSDDHYLALLPSNLCLNNICQAKLEILSDADKLEWVQRSSTEVVSGFHLVPYEGCMTCLQLFPPQRRHQSSLTFTFRIMITVITIVV